MSSQLKQHLFVDKKESKSVIQKISFLKSLADIIDMEFFIRSDLPPSKSIKKQNGITKLQDELCNESKNLSIL